MTGRISWLGCAMCAAVVCGSVISVASADWDPGDDVKMTQPQLPGGGWDVSWYLNPQGMPLSNTFLADDWECSQTGDVTDIHFWYSQKNDYPATIDSIAVRIYDDDTYAPPGSQLEGWHVPGQLLWSDTFSSSEFSCRQYDTAASPEGFFIPDDILAWPDDHYGIHQCNIEDIDLPFMQQEGHVYWLAIEVYVEPVPTWPMLNGAVGWHTATTAGGYLSNSVYQRPDGTWYMITNPEWDGGDEPPYYPGPDLAFVITPEPATLGLLALGGLAMIRRRRTA